MPTRRRFLAAAPWLLGLRVPARPADPRGVAFLRSLFDPALGLLPEFRGARTCWLYHDNYLAAKLLDAAHPDLARTIEATIRACGVTTSGKIEILFDEARDPLPFRHSRNIDVKRVGETLIRTEVVSDRPLHGWESYADLRFLAAIARAATDRSEAVANLRAGLDTWDGRGFRDRVVAVQGHYATYKLALALLAADRLGIDLPMRTAILDRLASLQNAEGGWITDYTPDGRPRGLANVETTCLALLAAPPERRPSPQ